MNSEHTETPEIGIVTAVRSSVIEPAEKKVAVSGYCRRI